MATNIVDPPVERVIEEAPAHINNEKAVAPVAPAAARDSIESDSINGEFPTEDELHHLRRVPDNIPWRVYTIAFVELCERFSYYGTTVVCKLKFTIALSLNSVC